MTESPFDAPPPPGAGDKFVNAEHEGDLLIVKITGTGRETFDSGESEFIVADVTVVEGRDAGTVYADAWLFGRVLFGQLKRSVGRTLLGRLVKGQAQRGKSAPWQLEPATPEETRRALEFQHREMSPPAAEPARADPWGRSSTRDDDAPPF